MDWFVRKKNILTGSSFTSIIPKYMQVSIIFVDFTEYWLQE